MNTEKSLLAVIIRGISIWRDMRFVQWWDMTNVILCAIGSGVLTMVANLLKSRLIYRNYLGLDPFDSAPPNRWIVAATAGAFFLTVYFLLHILVHITKRRGSSEDGAWGSDISPSPLVEKDTEHLWIQSQIVELFRWPGGRRNRDLSEVIRKYDALYNKAGLREQRASLFVDGEQAGEQQTGRSLLEIRALLDRAFTNTTVGEVEPVTLPIRFRLSSALVPVCIFAPFFFSTLVKVMSNMMTGIDPGAGGVGIISDAITFGWGALCVILIGYAVLREQGVFPLPLFRGECSAEKTRIFHRFRWKTFKPGRDLAIVRFTSNQEADIAFLGADGSHATARVGGKYLEHFIACWAAPR